MSKKTKNTLGRSLIKDRFGNKSKKKFVCNNSMLHTTEIQDGYDWGRLNLQSVTEQSSFREFLSTAELAGTEFEAEKLNIKFVDTKVNIGLLTQEEKDHFLEEFKKHEHLVKIPRRPKWNTDMTAEELHQKERESFLDWHRSLAFLQEKKGLLLTPFEKNIEFWRQLWRVIERSDVVVQIVDARNPLLFWCEDLEKYVKEVSEDKLNLILLNKADHLTDQQRESWAKYFTKLGVRIAFFSATAETTRESENTSPADLDLVNKDKNLETSVKEIATRTETTLSESEDTSPVDLDLVNKDKNLETSVKEVATPTETTLSESENTLAVKSVLVNEVQNLDTSVDETAGQLSTVLNTFKDMVNTKLPDFKYIQNSSKILSREELITYLEDLHSGSKVNKDRTTIGLVGYPNVGKSSTINTLMTVKKVSVSATPGKTKHFQTLQLGETLLLCDCPGLVMPSFVYTKAEMILNGVLPVDQIRDHVPPISLIASLIPRHVFEAKYGIMLPKPLEGEDENRPPTSEEILNAYGYNRGYMTANGQPDNPRAARYIIKDFINGKLVYVYPPPDVDDDEKFQNWPPKPTSTVNRILPPREVRATRPHKMTSEEFDKTFFGNGGYQVHSKGQTLGSSSNSSLQKGGEKPWKKHNKHANKNKKEKLRKVYAHLDQH